MLGKGQTHASYRNTLRSFENSFFGMCDKFRIRPTFTHKIANQLGFFSVCIVLQGPVTEQPNPRDVKIDCFLSLSPTVMMSNMCKGKHFFFQV